MFALVLHDGVWIAYAGVLAGAVLSWPRAGRGMDCCRRHAARARDVHSMTPLLAMAVAAVLAVGSLSQAVSANSLLALLRLTTDD